MLVFCQIDRFLYVINSLNGAISSYFV